MSSQAPKHFIWRGALAILSCIALVVLSGCGGGTSGTGLQTFDGQVKSADGVPIVGASVTLTATGDSSLTDQQGRFVLRSAVDPKADHKIEFLLEAEDFSGTFEVPEGALTEGSSQITVDVVVDPVGRTLELTNFTLTVQMTGRCASAFSNDEVIRQILELPRNTSCTLDAELKGNGLLRGNVPLVLQYRACSGKPGVWQNMYVSTTGVGDKLGKAQIPFSFSDSAKFCRYRVVAPYNYRDYRSAVFALQTLSEQAAQAEIAAGAKK